MSKLIMTKGLPGSGKTTWAIEYLEKNHNTILVSKDDLRAMMFNSAWSGNREQYILKVRDFVVAMALAAKKDVVVHDTNFVPKHETRLRQLASEAKADFVIQDFTKVPLETCIEQNLRRIDSVSEKTIRDMYNDWIKIDPKPLKFNPKLRSAIICDLDGTLCLFDRKEKNAFDRDFENDIPNTPVLDVLHKMVTEDVDLFLVSGRNDKFRKVTEEWLANTGVRYSKLIMRKDKDGRKDSIVKKEIYTQYFKGKYNIQFVFDDRNQVVELWRSLGIPCFQVADGDF